MYIETTLGGGGGGARAGARVSVWRRSRSSRQTVGRARGRAAFARSERTILAEARRAARPSLSFSLSSGRLARPRAVSVGVGAQRSQPALGCMCICTRTCVYRSWLSPPPRRRTTTPPWLYSHSEDFIFSCLYFAPSLSTPAPIIVVHAHALDPDVHPTYIHAPASFKCGKVAGLSGESVFLLRGEIFFIVAWMYMRERARFVGRGIWFFSLFLVASRVFLSCFVPEFSSGKFSFSSAARARAELSRGVAKVYEGFGFN